MIPRELESYVPFIALAIYLLLSLIVFWLSFSFVKWFLKAIWRKVESLWSVVKGDQVTKLISLSIAGLFFPLVISTLIKTTLIFGIDLLISLTRALIANSNNVLQSCQYIESDALSQCARVSVVQVFSIFIDNFQRSYAQLRIAEFPIIKLIFFLALLVGLSESIDGFRVGSESNEQRRGWINALLSRPAATSNLLFFGIVATSLYLSIASIAAIPSLQDSQVVSQEVSVEKLEQRLDESVGQFKRRFSTEDDEFDQSLNPLFQINTSSSNPLTVLEEYISAIDAFEIESNSAQYVVDRGILSKEELPEAQYDQFNRAVEDLLLPLYNDGNSFLQQAKSQRESVVRQAERLLTETTREVEEQRRAAATEYEFSNVNRKGSRETAEHFLAIANWFDRSISRKEAQLSECFSTIQSLDRDYRFEVTRLMYIDMPQPTVEAFTQLVLEQIRNDAVSSFPRYLPSDVFDNNNQNLVEEAFFRCQLPSLSNEIPPKRPLLGDNLGPFKFVASWLLQTESLPLALITGLMGFGLLGSACSSFVREQIIDDKNSPPSTPELSDSLQITSDARRYRPLVSDLPKVTIIGLSAAILAFLSVVGGLSIFSTDTTDPNPYALLLACLVAAAFGEDIWDWARHELHRRKEQFISQKTVPAQDDTQVSDEENDSIAPTDTEPPQDEDDVE